MHYERFNNRISFGSTLKARNFRRTCCFCTAVTCSVKVSLVANTTLRYWSECTCSTGSPLMTVWLMTVLFRRKSMHIYFVCWHIEIQKVSTAPTGETYHWRKILLVWGKITQKSEHGCIIRIPHKHGRWINTPTVISIQSVQKWTQDTILRRTCVANKHWWPNFTHTRTHCWP